MDEKSREKIIVSQVNDIRKNKTMNNHEASTPEHRRSRSGVAVASETKTDVAALAPRVDIPTDADVLCSQSRDCINHPGNQFFRRVVEDFADRYERASVKQEKMTLTKMIVAIIHDHDGRFLAKRRCQKDNNGTAWWWEEISTSAARDKVSHALRTTVASWKRIRQQQDQQIRLESRIQKER